MRERRKWRYVRPLILLAIFVMLLSCHKRDMGMGGFERGGYLLFDSIDLNSGEKISMEDLLEEDGAVFLNFWGVMCVACREEIVELNRLYSGKMKNGTIIEFIAVNSDGLEGAEIKEAMNHQNIEIKFPVVADPDGEITRFYTNGFTPHNVIITRKGGRELEVTGYNEKLFGEIERKLLELSGRRQKAE